MTALPAGSAPTPGQLAVYPQAGILWQDLYVNNYLDLDDGPGIRDWSCGSQTYDGHTGIDTDIRSFREMDIGVPVFAVLAGHVISVQDGNYDRQYGRTTARFDNHVVLDHGSGRFTIYGHLRRGIRLRRGQAVRRGEQLGWTASSGSSSWPHLHFTIIENERPQEPFAGPCRPGESWWLEQPKPPSGPYARDLALSDRPLIDKADLPFDQSQRTGTFIRGTRLVRFRLEFGGAAGARELRVKFLRPDGTAALDRLWPIPFAMPHGSGYARLAYRLALQPLGRWRLLADVDGTPVVDAPFRVVAPNARIRNRPPNPGLGEHRAARQRLPLRGLDLPRHRGSRLRDRSLPVSLGLGRTHPPYCHKRRALRRAPGGNGRAGRAGHVRRDPLRRTRRRPDRQRLGDNPLTGLRWAVQPNDSKG